VPEIDNIATRACVECVEFDEGVGVACVLGDYPVGKGGWRLETAIIEIQRHTPVGGEEGEGQDNQWHAEERQFSEQTACDCTES